MYRPPSRRQTAFVITDDLVGTLLVTPRQLSATQADQVNQLVSASEADPDLGFMARLMALCCLPRTNPGSRIRYIRQNGPYTLVMTAGGKSKLPFGNFPRLLRTRPKPATIKPFKTSGTRFCAS